MNIFYLSECPFEAARMQCDKHVVKMAVETAQMLSTVLGGPYKPTHANHPSTIWAGKHTIWAYDHYLALCAEYQFRYGRVHKCLEHADLFQQLMIQQRPVWQRPAWEDPPQCMPEQYHGPDTVEAYRNYYAGEKAYFARWDNGRPAPDWYLSRVAVSSPAFPTTTTTK